MRLSKGGTSSRFLAGLTRWDKLLVLFTLPFLVLFGIPENQHYLKVVAAAIVAIIGIIATNYASHKKKTSYTPWAELVFKEKYEGERFDRLRDFYNKDVKEEINRLRSAEASTEVLPDKKTKIADVVHMLSNNMKWNNTQWELFCDWFYKIEQSEKTLQMMMKAETKFDPKSSNTTILIFGVIYAFIAGWAIANNVITFSGTFTLGADENFLDYLNKLIHFQLSQAQYENLLIFLSFYPIAIILYHSGAIFLSSDAAALITGGDKGRTLTNFGIILADGMILYLMSERTTSKTPESFVSLVLMLMVISIVWVLVFRYLDARNTKVDWPIYMEWLYFDLFILIFCVVFLYSYSDSNNTVISYLCMFCVFATMAVCNYNFAWDKLWGKFQATD